MRLESGVVILNPKAGGDGAQRVRRWARERELPVVGLDESEDGEGALLAAGGDGTVRAVAERACAQERPLAVIPMGTANDFARGLDLPRALDACLEALDGELYPLSLPAARADGRLFLNAATIGLSTASAKLRDPDKKRWLGTAEYARALARTLLEFDAFSSRLDDGPPEDTLQVTVGHSRFHGGGLPTAAGATPVERELVVVRLLPFSAAESLEAVGSFLAGHGDAPECIRVERCQSVTLRTDPEQQVALDGEPIATSPIRFDFADRDLTVLEPVRNGSSFLLSDAERKINETAKALERQRRLLEALDASGDRAQSLQRALELLDSASARALATPDADRLSLEGVALRASIWFGAKDVDEVIDAFDREREQMIARILHLPELNDIRDELHRVAKSS